MLKIKKTNVEIFKKHNTSSEKFGGYIPSEIYAVEPQP